MKITAAHTAVVEGNDDLTIVSIDADSTARRPHRRGRSSRW
jgi:hypothetical protein